MTERGISAQSVAHIYKQEVAHLLEGVHPEKEQSILLTSILTQHHVERVEPVSILPVTFNWILLTLDRVALQGKMYVREEGEGCYSDITRSTLTLSTDALVC